MKFIGELKILWQNNFLFITILWQKYRISIATIINNYIIAIVTLPPPSYCLINDEYFLENNIPQNPISNKSQTSDRCYKKTQL